MAPGKAGADEMSPLVAEPREQHSHDEPHEARDGMSEGELRKRSPALGTAEDRQRDRSNGEISEDQVRNRRLIRFGHFGAQQPSNDRRVALCLLGKIQTGRGSEHTTGEIIAVETGVQPARLTANDYGATSITIAANLGVSPPATRAGSGDS